jgi:hypothetical protein
MKISVLRSRLIGLRSASCVGTIGILCYLLTTKNIGGKSCPFTNIIATTVATNLTEW